MVSRWSLAQGLGKAESPPFSVSLGGLGVVNFCCLALPYLFTKNPEVARPLAISTANERTLLVGSQSPLDFLATVG